MAAQNNNNQGTGIGIEDLLNALITTFQSFQATHPQAPHSPAPDKQSGPQSGNGTASPPQESHEGVPALALGEKLLREGEPWMERLWRSDGKGGWTKYGDYHVQNQSAHMTDHTPQEAAVDTDTLKDDGPAVYLDVHAEYKNIAIQSPHLIHAFNKVNEHPSLRKQEPNTMELYEPFSLLFYHLENVREEIARLDNPEAQADFKALECAAKEVETVPRWSAARAENLDSGSLVRFDTFWRLFRAGDLVVHTDGLGNKWLLTLTDVEEYKNKVRANQTGQILIEHYMEFWTWCLSWNAQENKLERKVAMFRIDHFAGAREAHLLSLYPVRYQRTHPSVDEFLQSLTARGRDWFKLIAAGTSCLEYDGPVFSKEALYNDGGQKGTDDPKVKNARVVVSKASKEFAVTSLNHLSPFKHGSGLSPAEIDAREQYQWDDLPATKPLSDDQARFCLPLVGCYAVEDKKFYLVSAEKLRPVAWDADAMGRLVLDEEKKTLLEGLVGQHYSKDQNGHQRDFIPKKGEGLVVLLHGPPGVGKTLTAESLAQHVKKPLISLSIGNLIWDESKLQERLVNEFSRAVDWDAILLLDEADVVLEERSFEDVRRNAIVSVFLRELEYYQGVLFLTTNRISTMDVAFQSRIQIGIGFKDLTPRDRKKIWLNLLTLNQDNHRNRNALDEIKESADKLAKWELNGREIRNVLNIADACARRRTATGWMTYEDIEKAARATLEFKDILEMERSNLKTEQTVWTPYSRGVL